MIKHVNKSTYESEVLKSKSTGYRRLLGTLVWTLPNAGPDS